MEWISRPCAIHQWWIDETGRELMGTPVTKLNLVGRLSLPKALLKLSNVSFVHERTIHMGLWYPKDNAMSLTAYADADHAGCQDSRRSTSGSAQFLGDRLVSWSSKKQRSTAISTTEAEYIAMSGPKHYQENDSMAEKNVPAQPPTRTDEQIVPRSQWLTIGKSNLLFNAQKIQKNPIFQISVDILKNSSTFSLLEGISDHILSTQLHPFELPPTGDTVLDFVNELGYPEPVEFVSSKDSGMTNPDTQSANACGESSPKLMLIMQSKYGKI
ncbi:hypothetical protein Tco_0658150 [Tanacetum coccineum]